MSTDEYRRKARRALRTLAASGVEFTADDLVERVGHPDNGHSANGRNNMIGSLFREARGAGLIEPIGVAQSRQPHRKGGMVRTWRASA